MEKMPNCEFWPPKYLRLLVSWDIEDILMSEKYENDIYEEGESDNECDLFQNNLGLYNPYF